MLDANFPVLLQSFFTTRLMAQRKVSSHTIVSYRDTFRLLLHRSGYARHRPSWSWITWTHLSSERFWMTWRPVAATALAVGTCV